MLVGFGVTGNVVVLLVTFDIVVFVVLTVVLVVLVVVFVVVLVGGIGGGFGGGVTAMFVILTLINWKVISPLATATPIYIPIKV